MTGFARLRQLCVFAGTQSGSRPAHRAAATELGTLLAEREIGLVYGGASIGLMGAVASATLAAGGKVVGVLPRALMEREGAHEGLTDLHIVDSMHERKALANDLADGFLALPGGLGTFEELLEAATWGQLGIHRKPVSALSVNGYFDGLFDLLDEAVSEGFLTPGYRDFLFMDTEVEPLLNRLEAWKALV